MLRNCLVAGLVFLMPTLMAGSFAAESPKTEGSIRKLTVKVDPIAGSQWSAKPGVRKARDDKEMSKLLGKALAKQIAGKIDFAKEDLVHVAWGSAGPPSGELQYEIKGGKAITFYVKEPDVAIRGQSFRVGNDFFAVPKGWNVSFAGSRQ